MSLPKNLVEKVASKATKNTRFNKKPKHGLPFNKAAVATINAAQKPYKPKFGPRDQFNMP